ncbi:hypothetical protein [Nocardia sp. SSK8]|uniref:hypothetical protein n=1 Tax=Nocardia sp. SSK8 TaxID=3120154 RepID=UPI00300960BE
MDYPSVIGAAVDALGVDRVSIVGLSLGGYYVAAAALRVPGGDHLVGNNHPAWLPALADHLTGGHA